MNNNQEVVFDLLIMCFIWGDCHFPYQDNELIYLSRVNSFIFDKVRESIPEGEVNHGVEIKEDDPQLICDL